MMQVPPEEYANQFFNYFRSKLVGDARELTPEMKHIGLGSAMSGMIPEGGTVTIAGEQVWRN